MKLLKASWFPVLGGMWVETLLTAGFDVFTWGFWVGLTFLCAAYAGAALEYGSYES